MKLPKKTAKKSNSQLVKTGSLITLCTVFLFFAAALITNEYKRSDTTNAESVQTAAVLGGEQRGSDLSLPFYFEKNNGQVDSSVEFLAKGQQHTSYFTKDRVVYDFLRDTSDKAEASSVEQSLQEDSFDHLTFSQQFLGANKNAILAPINKLLGKTNYLIGDVKDHVTDIPTFSGIIYNDLYAGIDLVYKEHKGQLKYEYIVEPYADFSQIQMAYTSSYIDKNGTEENKVKLKQSNSGGLLVETEKGVFEEQQPYAYQIVDGKTIEVSLAFNIIEKKRYGFRVGEYDPSKPLYIDPTIEYTTFLDGSNNALASMYPIGFDTLGNVVLIGATGATDYPTQSPFQGANAGSTDTVIVKLAADGQSIVYATYLGGSNSDSGRAGAVHSNDDVAVCGFTNSSADFPRVAAVQNVFGGDQSDFFISKLNAAGNALVFSTFYGGNEREDCFALDMDSTGAVYAAGSSASTGDWPLVNELQSVFGGAGISSLFNEAVYVKLNSAGTVVEYSSYFGGDDDENILDIAVDTSDRPVFVGFTSSTDITTVSAYDSTLNGGDTFVFRINAAGNAYDFSTYLGGNLSDTGVEVEVASNGNIVVGGETRSLDFPIVGGAQSVHAGNNDIFVAVFNTDFSTLIASSYYGGTSGETMAGMSLDHLNQPWIVGSSGDGSTVPTEGVFTNPGASEDDLVVAFNNTASNILFASTFGELNTTPNGIFADGLGNAYVAGGTSNAHPTVNALQPTNTSTNPIFVKKFARKLVIDDLAVSAGNESAVLTWSAIEGVNILDAGVNITDYVVEFSNDNFVSNVQLFSDAVSPATGTEVTGLQPGTLYYFRARGVSSYGESVNSNIVQLTVQDLDLDNDTILDDDDNCPVTPNTNQLNSDFIASVTSPALTVDAGFVRRQGVSVIDSLGNSYVVYVDDSGQANDGLYIAKYDDAGSFVTSATLVGNDGNRTSMPHIDVDSSDNIHIVWHDAGPCGGGCAPEVMYMQIDSSLAFVVGATQVTATDNIRSKDPQIRVDSSDRVHIIWKDSAIQGLNSLRWDVFYLQLNAAASIITPSSLTLPVASTAAARLVDGPIDTAAADDFRMFYKFDVDSAGRLAIVWDLGETGANDLIKYKLFDISTAGILKLLTKDTLLEASDGNLSAEPSIVFDSRDILNICWHDQRDGGASEVFFKQINPGFDDLDGDLAITNNLDTIATTKLSSEDSETSSRCQISVDANDNIYVGWLDAKGLDANTDFKKYLVKMSSGGAVVMPETLIHNDAATSTDIIRNQTPLNFFGDSVTDEGVYYSAYVDAIADRQKFLRFVPGFDDGTGDACQNLSCGNGLIDPGEICDDNNLFSGDGCSSSCRLEAPVNAPVLTATGGDTIANLSWTGVTSVPAVSDWQIEFSTSPTALSTFNDGVSPVTAGTITGLVNQQQYYVRVRAINSSGTGPVSNTVLVIPRAIDNCHSGLNLNGPAPVVVESFCDITQKNTGTSTATWNETKTPASNLTTPMQLRGALQGFSYATGTEPNAVAVGDMNNDGLEDIVTANTTGDTFSIFPHEGDANPFQTRWDSAFTGIDGPGDIALADMDGNGFLDVVLSNRDGSGFLSITFNSGVGKLDFRTFNRHFNFANGTTPRAIAIGDLNNDNLPDVVSSHRDISTLSVFLNNPADPGNLNAKIDWAHNSNRTVDIAIGDINNDGNQDVVAASRGDIDNGGTLQGKIALFFGTGAGGFTPLVEFEIGQLIRNVSLADIDGDSDLDIIASSIFANATGFNGIIVLLNNGSGVFTRPADPCSQGVSYCMATSRPYSTAIIDLDLDGDLDIMAALPQTSQNSIYLGNGDGTFAAGVDYAMGSFALDVVPVEMDLIPPKEFAFSDFNTSTLFVHDYVDFIPANNIGISQDLANNISYDSISLTTTTDFNSSFDLEFSNNGTTWISAGNSITTDFNEENIAISGSELYFRTTLNGTIADSVLMDEMFITLNVPSGGAVQRRVPNSPSGTETEIQSETELIYSWVDESSNETGFKIFTDEEDILETGQNIQSVRLMDLTPNTFYELRKIAAFNSNGQSSPVLFPAKSTFIEQPQVEIVDRAESSLLVRSSVDHTNIDIGLSGLQYELLIPESFSTDEEIIQTPWSQEAFHTFESLPEDLVLQVRVRARNQDGIETEWSQFTEVFPQKISTEFDIALSLRDNDSSTLSRPLDTSTVISGTAIVKNTGEYQSSNLFFSLEIPELLGYIPGSLLLDGQSQTDAVDEDALQFQPKAILGSWSRLPAGEELTVNFQLQPSTRKLIDFRIKQVRLLTLIGTDFLGREERVTSEEKSQILDQLSFEEKIEFGTENLDALLDRAPIRSKSLDGLDVSINTQLPEQPNTIAAVVQEEINNPVIELLAVLTASQKDEAIISNKVEVEPDMETLNESGIAIPFLPPPIIIPDEPGPNPPPNPEPKPGPDDQPNPNPTPTPSPSPNPGPNPEPGPNPSPDPEPKPNPDEEPIPPEGDSFVKVQTDGTTFTVDAAHRGITLQITGIALLENEQIRVTGMASKSDANITLIFSEGIVVSTVTDSQGEFQASVLASRFTMNPGEKTIVTIDGIAEYQELRTPRVELGQVDLSIGLENTQVNLVSTFVSLIEKQIRESMLELQTGLATLLPLVVLASASLWAYLPLLPTLLYHVFSLFLAYFSRRKRESKFFGTVYDSITKDPLSLAIVRIYNKETEKLVLTAVTDKTGAYEALLEPGEYSIKVIKPQYAYPSKIVTGLIDGEYSNLIAASMEMTVKADEVNIPDIPLDPIDAKKVWSTAGFLQKLWLAFQKAGDVLSLPLLIIGTVISWIVVITVPENEVNWFVAIAYLIILGLQIKLRPHIEKAWGVVYDLSTNANLPLTAIQLIDTDFGKVVKSRLTDYQGRFSFTPEPGKYQVKASKEGYEQAEQASKQKDRNPISGEVEVSKPHQRIDGDIAMKKSEEIIV